ncbi:zincin-like metallopeptidase domain-containing protein [Acinetobacter baumannii]
MKNFKTNAEVKFAELVDQIESKFITGQWVMPFKAARPHFNLLSNKRYNGINAWILTVIAVQNDFKSKAWITYKQAQTKGWHAKKGEVGTPIQYWNTIKDKVDPEKEKWFVKYYYVFNLDQLVDEDGKPIDIDSTTFADLPSFNDQLTMLECIINDMGVDVHNVEGLGRAFYRRSEHAVYLPTAIEFNSQKAYLATLLHELGHATHRFVRPNWEKGPFGSVLYAKEECVAELTSVFVSSMLGIEKIALDSHAGYIADWLLTAKEDDPRFFAKAVKEATKAAFFMWDILYPEKSIDPSDIGDVETVES